MNIIIITSVEVWSSCFAERVETFRTICSSANAQYMYIYYLNPVHAVRLLGVVGLVVVTVVTLLVCLLTLVLRRTVSMKNTLDRKN